MSSTYQVLPSRRVRVPPSSAIKRNSPRCDRSASCRCGAFTNLYGDHSFIGIGCDTTSNDNRRGLSHVVIGSTNRPVENSQCRIGPPPVPSIPARNGYATAAAKNYPDGAGTSPNHPTLCHTRTGGSSNPPP